MEQFLDSKIDPFIMFQRLSYYISVSVDADDSAAIDATVAITANDLIIVTLIPALLLRMMMVSGPIVQRFDIIG